MKGLIDVKPKVERIYQAMQYTGENMYDIYRLFRKHDIKFNVNNDSYICPTLDIEYTGAPCMLLVDQYIVYSYPFNNDFDDTKCEKLRILEIGLELSEIQNEYKIADFNRSRATVTLEPHNSGDIRALLLSPENVDIFVDLFIIHGNNTEISKHLGRLFFSMGGFRDETIRVYEGMYIVLDFRSDGSISILDYNLFPKELQEKYEIIK
jgi:hypothetical protein